MIKLHKRSPAFYRRLSLIIAGIIIVLGAATWLVYQKHEKNLAAESVCFAYIPNEILVVFYDNTPDGLTNVPQAQVNSILSHVSAKVVPNAEQLYESAGYVLKVPKGSMSSVIAELHKFSQVYIAQQYQTPCGL